MRTPQVEAEKYDKDERVAKLETTVTHIKEDLNKHEKIHGILFSRMSKLTDRLGLNTGKLMIITAVVTSVVAGIIVYTVRGV